jgi:hypothetical protein
MVREFPNDAKTIKNMTLWMMLTRYAQHLIQHSKILARLYVIHPDLKANTGLLARAAAAAGGVPSLLEVAEANIDKTNTGEAGSSALMNTGEAGSSALIQALGDVNVGMAAEEANEPTKFEEANEPTKFKLTAEQIAQLGPTTAATAEQIIRLLQVPI